MAKARPADVTGVKLGILDDFIGFHLRQAQDAAYRAFIHRLGDAGFKTGRFAVMMVLSYNPGISPGVLGRVIARDKSTVTPLIQDLEKKGWINRKRSTLDRRSISLSLTAEGKAALKRLLKAVRAHDRKLDQIAGVDKIELLNLLKRIARQISG